VKKNCSSGHEIIADQRLAEKQVGMSRLICNYYMAGITSGEMVDCDWLRSTFRGPLYKNKRVHFKTKQQN
jgi:hypothetical protein